MHLHHIRPGPWCAHQILMQTVSSSVTAEQFLQDMDTSWPERRLLDEIRKLSSDELAAVLVQWYRNRLAGEHGSN